METDNLWYMEIWKACGSRDGREKNMLYPVMDKSNFIQVDSVMGQVSSLLFTQLKTSKTQIEI